VAIDQINSSWNFDFLLDKLKYSKTNQDFFDDAMNTRTEQRALRRARC
jgi:hypothetical protein